MINCIPANEFVVLLVDFDGMIFIIIQRMKKDFDSMAKVAVIGDSSVGKTNLLLRYVSSEYHQTHIATIGIDFKVKTVDINGYKIKLQIWDTAGQERFRNLTGTIYQGAEAVILTYAVDNRQSFNSLSRWMEDVKNFAKKEVVVAIVGNKCDLKEDRAVSKEEGEALAGKMGAIFYETSAKENINIEEMFRSIAVQLHKRVMQKSKEKEKQFEQIREKPKSIVAVQKVEDSKKSRNNSTIEKSSGTKQKIVLNTSAVKESSDGKRKKCC